VNTGGGLLQRHDDSGLQHRILEFINARANPFVLVRLSGQIIEYLDPAVYRLVDNVVGGVDIEVIIPERGVSTEKNLSRFDEILRTNFDSVVISDEIDFPVRRRREPVEEPAYSGPLHQFSAVLARTQANDRYIAVVSGRATRPTLQKDTVSSS
jgi:hypothetical protein